MPSLSSADGTNYAQNIFVWPNFFTYFTPMDRHHICFFSASEESPKYMQKYKTSEKNISYVEYLHDFFHAGELLWKILVHSNLAVTN